MNLCYSNYKGYKVVIYEWPIGFLLHLTDPKMQPATNGYTVGSWFLYWNYHHQMKHPDLKFCSSMNLNMIQIICCISEDDTLSLNNSESSWPYFAIYLSTSLHHRISFQRKKRLYAKGIQHHVSFNKYARILHKIYTNIEFQQICTRKVVWTMWESFPWIGEECCETKFHIF